MIYYSSLMLFLHYSAKDMVHVRRDWVLELQIYSPSGMASDRLLPWIPLSSCDAAR
jgi:hypothetical protein